MQGRATARVNIDAFLAGKQLLKDEGYQFQDVVLNLGYSQGGSMGMWVNRLVAEGYRSDELPKIDYCVIGGGPYDMYAHYRKLAEDNVSQFSVALPLIMSGMIDAGGKVVKYEDVFLNDFAQVLPELLDSKAHNTIYINEYIYNNFGNAIDRSLPIDKIAKPAFFDEQSDAMRSIISLLKENSLVYEAWKPDNTDSISFVHSTADEAVPILNMTNMEAHLISNGYRSFDIHYYEGQHTTTAMSYIIFAMNAIGNFVPSGIESVVSDVHQPMRHSIYTIDGRLLRTDASLESLPQGIYIVDGKKVVK